MASSSNRLACCASAARASLASLSGMSFAEASAGRTMSSDISCKPAACRAYAVSLILSCNFARIAWASAMSCDPASTSFKVSPLIFSSCLRRSGLSLNLPRADCSSRFASSIFCRTSWCCASNFCSTCGRLPRFIRITISRLYARCGPCRSGGRRSAAIKLTRISCPSGTTSFARSNSALPRYSPTRSATASGNSPGGNRYAA